MRILFIIFSLFSFTLIGQPTKIKIKKAEPEYKVTIAGLDTGTISLDALLTEKKLSIINNPLKLKIYSYDAFISFDENVNSRSLTYSGKNEKITKELLDDLEDRLKTGVLKIHFTRIQAYNSFNETINLNDVILGVTNNMSNEETAIKTTYFSIVGNTLLAALKWCAGYFGNSFALIADAIESTSDIFSSFLVLFGIKYSNKPADKNHPYGHGRAEPLVTFVVVAFLVTSATIIAYDSVKNIRNPHDLPKPFTLIVLGAIIIWKEISFQIVLRKSKQTHSTSLKADAWHHRSDAITSIAAFIGISIALIFGKGYESADDWAALFASGFILYNSYQIFRPALGEIMDEHLYDDLIEDIRKVSLTVKGVVATEKCFIRKSGMKYHVDLHALVDGKITVTEGHDIAHDLKDTLRKEIPQLGHVLIHIEPSE